MDAGDKKRDLSERHNWVTAHGCYETKAGLLAEMRNDLCWMQTLCKEEEE